jgi:hypothetical protein
VAQQLVLPPDEMLRRPVAVRTLDRRGPILGDLLEQLGGQSGRRVVAIDQHGEPGRVGGGHDNIVAQ